MQNRRHGPMNRVLLTGRLTRDPELRTTAAGKAVVQFSMTTHEHVGVGKERSEFYAVAAWGGREGTNSTTWARGGASPRRAASTSARASRSASRAGSRPARGTTT